MHYLESIVRNPVLSVPILPHASLSANLAESAPGRTAFISYILRMVCTFGVFVLFLSTYLYRDCLRELPHHRALWTRYIPSLGRAQCRKVTYWSITERSVFGICSHSAKFHYHHRIFLYSLVIFGTHQGCQPLSWATLYCARYLGPVYPPDCQGIPRLSPHRKIGALSLVLLWMLTPSWKGYCALVVSR